MKMKKQKNKGRQSWGLSTKGLHYNVFNCDPLPHTYVNTHTHTHTHTSTLRKKQIKSEVKLNVQESQRTHTHTHTHTHTEIKPRYRMVSYRTVMHLVKKSTLKHIS